MGNNPFDVLKMFQGLQKQMEDMQEKLAKVRVIGSAGGDMVEVEITASLEVIKVTLDPTLAETQDRSVLEDLIAAAVNDAVRRVEKVSQEKMGSLTAGLNIPGLNMPL